MLLIRLIYSIGLPTKSWIFSVSSRMGHAMLTFSVSFPLLALLLPTELRSNAQELYDEVYDKRQSQLEPIGGELVRRHHPELLGASRN